MLAVVLYYALLPLLPVLEPDEGRYAEIPREMLAAGDWLTPRLDGLLYFEKPPLHYWLTAAAEWAFGVNGFGVRFWTATPGLGTALLVFGLARSLGGRRAGQALANVRIGQALGNERVGQALGNERVGLLAALVALSAPYFFALAQVATLDMTLTFGLTAALVSFWFAHRAVPGERARWAWYGLFGGAALAVMTKGLVGIVIPGGVVFLYLLLTGQWRILRAVPWLSGTLLFAALAVPWHVAVARANPSFAWFYFVHEHLLRYATSEAKRAEPAWYFLAVLLVGGLPWSGLAPAVARLRDRLSWLAVRRDRAGLVYLGCWAGFVVLFFSVSQSKLAPYVLPATPALAVTTALVLARLEAAGASLRRAERIGLLAAALCCFALGLAIVAFGSGAVAGLGEQPAFHLLPCLVGLALAVAAARLARLAWRSATRGLAGTLLAVSALLSLGLFALYAIEAPSRSARDMAVLLRSRLQPGDRIYCYGGYVQTLPVYLGRTVDGIGPSADLEFGISQLAPEEAARRFPPPSELARIWRSPETVYLVVDQDFLARLPALGVRDPIVLHRNKVRSLLVNHPPPGG